MARQWSAAPGRTTSPRGQEGFGARATTTAWISSAPAERRARAAAVRVAPVVATSSTTRTDPRTGVRARQCGLERRVAGEAADWGPQAPRGRERESVVEGKSVAGRVCFGGRGAPKKK